MVLLGKVTECQVMEPVWRKCINGVMGGGVAVYGLTLLSVCSMHWALLPLPSPSCFLRKRRCDLSSLSAYTFPAIVDSNPLEL